jgi:hypothetical protein
MEGVNKALPTKAADYHGPKTLSDILLDPPEPPKAKIGSSIYTRIAGNLDHVKDMLNVEKAEEYGNPRVMCQNISQRWFGCENAEVDVAIMMAELKIERIKYDHSKEDSYLDAIAYLTMALAFMQAAKEHDYDAY